MLSQTKEEKPQEASIPVGFLDGNYAHVDILCVSIGAEIIERFDGQIGEALRLYSSHAAEIVLASIIQACDDGKSPAEIRDIATKMAIEYELTFVSP